MTTPLVFPATPRDALSNGRWETWLPANAWPTPDSLPVHAPSLFHADHYRPCPTAEQRQAMALYAVVDAFWRIQQWLEEQGKGAFVSWRMEAESTWTGLDDDYALVPRQCLVVDLIPRRGRGSPYALVEEESKEMAGIIQRLTGQDLPNAVWEHSTPLDQRMEQFLGPSYHPLYRAQRLEKDLPAPQPARSALRF